MDPMRTGSKATRALQRALVAAALTTGLLALAGPASAHAVLVETDPVADAVLETSPGRVVARFNEAVEVAFGALRVYDTDGERVDAGSSFHPDGDPKSVATMLEEGLPDGTYTATYRVVSADGHPVEAAFVFHVGAPGEKPQGIGSVLLSGEGGSGTAEGLIYGLARWVLFSGILGLVGAAVFLVVVAFRSPGLTDAPEWTSEWRRFAVVSWWATLGSTVVAFILQGAVAADVPLTEALDPAILGELLGTRYGKVAALRAVLVLVLGAAWVVAGRATANGRLPVPSGSTVGAEAARRLSPGLIGAGALLLVISATPGLSGHAGATSPVWFNVPVDAVHVAAAGAWIGGLALLLVSFRVFSGSSAAERVQILGPVVARFSDLAMIAVAILVVTGAIRSWVEVQALRALFEAPYGWVLLTKLAVFLPLLALGAVNNRMLKPRIDDAVKRSDDDEGGALARLRRSVAIEVALGAVVIAVTAVLVNLSPARVEAGVTGPFTTDVALGDNTLNVLVDPNEVGENIVHLTATSSDGSPAEIEAMKTRFSMPGEGIGPLIAEGRELGPGHFVVQGHQLSVPGRWVIQIEARVDRFTNLTSTVEVTVNR